MHIIMGACCSSSKAVLTLENNKPQQEHTTSSSSEAVIQKKSSHRREYQQHDSISRKNESSAMDDTKVVFDLTTPETALYHAKQIITNNNNNNDIVFVRQMVIRGHFLWTPTQQAVHAITQCIRQSQTLEILRFFSLDIQHGIQMATVVASSCLPTTLRELEMDAGGRIGLDEDHSTQLLQALLKGFTTTTTTKTTNKISKRTPPLLETLILNVRLDPHGALLLSNLVRNVPSLKHVSLKCTFSGYREISLLLPMMMTNHLDTLELHKCFLGPQGSYVLARAMMNDDNNNRPITLRKLSLHSNGIGDLGAMEFGEMLLSNNNRFLQELVLCHQRMGDQGLAALADGLRRNTTLKLLDLGENRIRKEGLVAMADCLGENTTLETMVLDHNEMGDDGATEMARALKHNTSLLKLSLVYTQIGNDGMAALARSLCVNTTLLGLAISLRPCDYQGLVSLRDALVSRNRTLQRIQLTTGSHPSEECRHISQDIKMHVLLNNVNAIVPQPRLTLWTPLARSEIRTNVDCIYLYLRSRPDLIANSG